MDPNQLRAVQGMLFVILPLVLLVFVVITLLPYWFIWKKAGFSPWLSLLMLIPMLNIVMLYVLAFAEWKVVPILRPTYGYPPASPPQG